MPATISCERCNGSGHVKSPSLLSGYEACPDCDANGYRPFYGAQCPSYPDCKGGCGLGCTKEHMPTAAKSANSATLTERLIQAAVDYESGRCSRRELSEARAAVEAAMPSAAQAVPDPFNRKQVEAVCRAICQVEGVDPDDDVFGDGCDAQWTRYADAVAAALAAQPPAAPVEPWAPTESMLEVGAQALADDVWHPPQKFGSLPPHDQNKFRRQALLVLKAVQIKAPPAVSPCSAATEDARPVWQQLQLGLLLGMLSDWRNADHEDSIRLGRSDVIAIIEGFKARPPTQPQTPTTPTTNQGD